MKIQKLAWFVSFVSPFLWPAAHGQSPTPTVRDVFSQVIEEAARETSKSEKPTTNKPKLEPWQTSPDEFAKELQRLFSKGADENELAKWFHGKEIDWPGILDTAQTQRSKADPNVTLAAVWITDVPLVAPDGSPAYIGELALNIPKFVMPRDKHVRVRATLSSISTMPVIDEKDHSKKTAVMIETEGETGAIVSANSAPSSPRASDAGGRDGEYWCHKLLNAPIEKYLPDGYSNPQVSLTDMTPAERAAGMICKISVNLHGPDPFNAIRFRVFNTLAAAERGLKSLPKLVPEISVYESQPQLQGRDTPCMVYTSGNRKLTFISCADQIKGSPVVVSGVSSQPDNGDSYDNKLVFRAADLLEAAEHHWASIQLNQNGKRIAEDTKTMSGAQLEPWQTSVPEFLKEVQRLYNKGGDENEIANRFDGKEVHWQGQVISSTKDDHGKGKVTVSLGDYSIKLPDGTVAPIDNLELIGPNFAPPPDTTIRFHVTLQRKLDIPMPIRAVMDAEELKQDNSTRKVIEILTENDAALE